MAISAAIVLGGALWAIKVNPDKRDLMLSEERCVVVVERWFTPYLPVKKPQTVDEESASMEVMGPEYAALMFRKAYEKNGRLTQMDFYGDLYYRGCKSSQSPVMKNAAALWYEAAAERHYAPSQWKLGRMYFEGDGVPEDRERGLSWLTLSAAEGSKEAAEYLRQLGEPVPSPLSVSTFEVLRIASEKAWLDRNKRYWSGILEDVAGLTTRVAAAYVGATQQANERKAPRSRPGQTATPQPAHKPMNPVPHMVTKPVYCSALASSSEVGDTIYLRISTFCS